MIKTTDMLLEELCKYGSPKSKLSRMVDKGEIYPIPKEIRRTLRIREGDTLQTTWQPWEQFCNSMLNLAKKQGW